MAIITISRQMGSWGTEIARGVAEKLCCECADKEMIGAILLRYGMATTLVEKFDEKKPLFWDSFSAQRKKFLRCIQKAVYDVAAKGRAVIVGRGGQILLKDFPGTLHVRIYAPLHVRLQRLLGSERMEEKQAHWMLRQSDQDSAGYIQSFFNAEWDDPNLYDLLINTDRLSVATAIQLIVRSASSPEIQDGVEEAGERLADLVLATRAEEKLAARMGEKSRFVEIKAEKGVLLLAGQVDSPLSKENCEQALAGLEGIIRVENKLLIVPELLPGIH